MAQHAQATRGLSPSPFPLGSAVADVFIGDFSPLEFRQRFSGTFSEDRNTIAGAWEKSHDGGDSEHDFALTYYKAG